MGRVRWAEMSPVLDELLEMDTAMRGQRLSELRHRDVALADALEDLLEGLSLIDREGFLEPPERMPVSGLAGQTIGPYTLERELGQGGMGSVWLARRVDGRYEGHVAVKFLNLALMLRGGAERFAREGNILARLAHPNIARLLDAGVTPIGQPYLVLEYIDGQPIDRYCKAQGLDVEARVRLFLDVLAAVAHAHHRLILHRDLKPGNILVTAEGEVKLLDFGIAKLMDDAASPGQATELTQLAGRPFTPAYAAPEQVQGGDVSTATDVYSLGVLLYILLGGTHPTAPTGVTSTPNEQLRAVVETEPKRLSQALAAERSRDAARELRGDLDNIVAKALKKAPAERYPNAVAFAEDLRRYLNDEPVMARPDTASYLLAKFIKRHRIGMAVAGALVLTLAGGVTVSLWEAREAERQRVQAEGLVEFMLGDLRKKLQPVGRLDALDGVGVKALAYYDAQDAARLDADSLGRRARALHLIGEIAQLRGNLDDALTVFQRAADSTGRLMARNPNDGQRIFDHAQSAYWVGYVAWRRGRAQEAQTSFALYRELAQRLVRLDPDNLDWRAEAAFAASNLGVLHLENSRPGEALAMFLESQEVFTRIVKSRPELALELAGAFGWVAKAREALGDYAAAIDAQQAKIAALGQMPGAAQNRKAQRLAANAAYELGRLHLLRGEVPQAAGFAADAVRRFEALTVQDSANLDWLAQLGAARLGHVELLHLTGDRAAALAELDRARTDIARLVATDATQVKWAVGFKGQALALQVKLTDVAKERPATEPLQAYLAKLASLEKAGSRLDVDQTRAAATVELLLGDVLDGSSQSAVARTHWQSCAERLSRVAANGDLASMALLAHARLRLGDIQAASALADRLQASTYRHPAYADLRQRLSRGAGAPMVLRESNPWTTKFSPKTPAPPTPPR